MNALHATPQPLARQPEPAAARAAPATAAAGAARIDASPRLVAQRRQWESIFGQAPGRPALQRKRTTKPADADLIAKFGVSGHNLPTAVLSGKATEPEKGAAIWAFLGTAYNTSKDNGTRYWDALQADIVKFQGAGKADLERANTAKRSEYDDRFLMNYATVKAFLRDDTQPEGGATYRVNSKGYDPARTARPDVKSDKNEGDYSNEFDVTTGKFKAAWNFAAHTSRDGGPTRYDDKALEAGKGVNNSEIVWQQAKAAAKRHFVASRTKDADVAAAMKGFSAIRRDTVINDETKEIVYMALEDGEEWVRVSRSWTSADEEFKAVLGTPNGRSSVYMLKDHLDELQKTIDTVTAARNGLDIKFKAL